MKTDAIVFPFELFGSGGTAAGAQLLGDALHEMIEDAKEEKKPARAQAYRNQVRIREHTFDTLDALNSWRETAQKEIQKLPSKKGFWLWLAGNHLGVLPLYENLPPDALVLQWDAHLDIYNLSDCTEELSHGNFLIHAQQPLPRIVNLGHRDQFLPQAHIDQFYHRVYSAESIHQDPEQVLAEIVQLCQQASSVFIDIDCDVFDPAYFPAVAHPLPFGISPALLVRFLHKIGIKKCAGVAISEFEPASDHRDQSLGTIIWLMEWILLKRYEPTV